MFIIITWDNPTETYVVDDYRAALVFESHQEAQDFIYNSDNDNYLASNTKIVELN